MSIDRGEVGGVSRWVLAAWFGIGLIVAGAAVIGVALLFAERSSLSDRALESDPEGPVATLGVVVVVAAVLAASLFAAAWLWWRIHWTQGAWPTGVWLLGLGIAGCGWWLFSCWDEAADSGFPGERALLVWIGTAGALLGIVVAGLASRQADQVTAPTARRPRLALCAGVVVVAVASTGSVVVAGDAAMVDQATATRVDPAPLPDSPTERRWQWHGTPLNENAPVLRAGAGVVTVTDDSAIVAIDGRTGRERWHHRRDDTYANLLGVLPDGSGVVASIGGMLHVFDAFTGELWWRDEARRWASLNWVRLLITESTVVFVGDAHARESFTYTAIDARTGDPRWHHEVSGCETDHKVASEQTIITETVCGRGAARSSSVVALDGATGKELWRLPSSGGYGELAVSDGTVIIGTTVVEEKFTALAAVSTRTGDVIADGGRPLDGVIASASPDSLDVITSDTFLLDDEEPLVALHRVGEPESRWTVAEELVDDSFDTPGHSGVAALGDSVALLTTDCRITMYDKETGATRTSMEYCAGLAELEDDAHMVAAPGAVVVKYRQRLVGYA